MPDSSRAMARARDAVGEPPRRVTAWGSAWRTFADGGSALADQIHAFIKDETSGTPEAERGLAARVFDAGRKLWSGVRHHNGREMTEGIGLAADLAHDLCINEQADGPKGFAERLADRTRALLHSERGSIPGEDFESMGAWWTSEDEPGGEREPSLEAEPEPPMPGSPDCHDIEMD